MSDPTPTDASLPTASEPLQFGIYLPQIRMSFGKLEALTRHAEECGFDSAWLLDHLYVRRQPELDVLEGWTALAALGARTSRIRLGHLVLCAPFRPPALLAKMAAALDVITGGRIDLGLGWGSVPEETERFGLAGDGPVDKARYLTETLEILELMFAGQMFSYDGEIFRLREAIGRPTPVGKIPIHIGGIGPKLTMPLVRSHADWWNCPAYGADRLAELVPLAGDARVSVQRPVCLLHPHDDRDEVLATAERRFGWWGGLVSGNPSEVAAALARDVELGAGMIIAQFTDFGRPETQSLFMEEVVPDLLDRIPTPAHGGTAATRTTN